MQTKTKDDARAYAALRGAHRVWAVAAIHGEAGRLVRLHRRLAALFQAGDRLVYLGNYMGGGEITATMDELVTFRRELMCRPGVEPWDIVYLRGCQEEMWHKLLQLQFAADPLDVFDWMAAQGLGATLAAYGGDEESARRRLREGAVAITKWTAGLRQSVQSHPGHDDLLIELKRAAYTAAGELVFVHAGLDGSKPLNDQTDSLWWDGGGFAAIREPYGGSRLVVRGYDPAHGGVTNGSHTACIDAGAGFGGPLRAVCYDLDGRAVDWLDG